MQKLKQTIGYLYINGLNDGQTKRQDRLAFWWWRRKGIELRHAHVNWLDGRSLDDKVNDLEIQLGEMLEQFSGVALIGTSAGGSLALNTFHRLKGRNICAVTAHARLKVGDYSQEQKNSMYRRANMDTDRPCKAFFDSVANVEADIISEVSESEIQRLLTLSSITDMIVPPSLMSVEGVRNHRSLAFGHAGGYLAHMIADRNLTIRFSETCLKK